MSKNRIVLEGFLGADPEMKMTTNNRKRSTMTLATNEEYKNAQGETVKDTQWHQLIAWGKLAELASSFKKGDRMQVAGKLGYRQYEDKKGQQRTVAEITVLEIAEKKTRVSVDLGADNEHG
ncbi:MAG TPA: single-stranded DNA-binding protein [Flavihumibacter sp.]|nr:single-stranded DNA-binding protein [Bacteroidota bacterium]HOA36900.1 single-stranded DNA-binding protein [Flavihumibacter sp.]HPZ87325.1 single-stranded DNA-binding protein [Flavihumibacter sp.]HQD08177.1 single-stranded DNA-binding protein [Flavihumibacter sp.]